MSTGVKDIIFQVAAALGNFSGGGSIGAASATVDLGSLITIAQTTASQTLTLPNPTDTTAGRYLVIANIGSQAFTVLGVSVAAGTSVEAVWTGAAWSRII